MKALVLLWGAASASDLDVERAELLRTFASAFECAVFLAELDPQEGYFWCAAAEG